MGFNLDKAREAAKQRQGKNEFLPIDLNEGNVQDIFNMCLFTENDTMEDCVDSTLFIKELGYDKDSKPVYFGGKRVEQNRKNILYLLGQLRAVHSKSYDVTSTESIYKYDSTKWTSDTVKLMELYHLGETTSGIGHFVKSSNSATINTARVKPTLSPKDPNFPAWWEKHKSEWEMPEE